MSLAPYTHVATWVVLAAAMVAIFGWFFLFRRLVGEPSSCLFAFWCSLVFGSSLVVLLVLEVPMA